MSMSGRCVLGHLGSAMAGTATIFETHTTTGAAGDVSHAARAAPVRSSSAARPSGRPAPRACACRGGSSRGSRSGAAACCSARNASKAESGNVAHPLSMSLPS